MSEPGAKRQKLDWDVPASIVSKRFVNPIRAIVDKMVIEPNPDYELIKLSIGDPSTFGNFQPDDHAMDQVIEAIKCGKKNGYAPATGYEDARAAIAQYYSSENSPLAADDIIIASGCSGALDLAIGALANEGQNILIPAPGFSLYKTLASAKGIDTRSYRCMGDKNWEVDLEHMDAQINENTAAIVVTNPSNPCGSNFSREHVVAIAAVAARRKIPIIADEIYADMVYSGAEFTSLASVTTEVPILACGGLAKRWLVPGWRLGWVLIRDRHGVLNKEVKGALQNMAQLLLGACTVVQAAVPGILQGTPDAFYAETKAKLKASAEMIFSGLSAVDGLNPVMPEGAMYLMCGIDVKQFTGFENDREFCEKLMAEVSVFVLPGEVFEGPGYFRIVTTVPTDKLKEAISRISKFCEAHRV